MCSRTIVTCVKLARRPPVSLPMHATVAICTWNRSRLLRQTLDQFLRLAVPAGGSWELLVVNNDSTDDTDSVLAEFESRLPLRRLFEPKPGHSHARNAALSAATGDYILFTDDDVLVDSTWLVELDAARRAYPQAAAFGGVIVPWFVEEPAPELAEVFYSVRVGFCGLDHQRDAGVLPENLVVVGANMAFRMAALGGLRFDPALGFSRQSLVGGGEVDFLRRLRQAGGDLVWWPRMKVHHYVLPSRLTLEYALRREQGEGKSQVLSGAGPRPADATWFGVPRWLLRRYLQAGIRRWLSYLVPLRPSPHLVFGPLPAPGSSRTVRVMTWRREMARIRGMIEAFRETRRRS